MLFVRYLALTTLAVWLGGMVTVGLIVAPSTFSVLQAADPAMGRVLAGALFGEILGRFHLLAYGCGGLMLACLLVLKFVGPPPRTFVPRLAIVAAMLALEVYAGVPVTREINALQSQVTGPMNALPATDGRRMRFDRLHQTSTVLMTINMALGLVLLTWYVREP
ncbi:MAG: DUF4149 domain-containing protein [Vicinamibacterales bacterium]